VTTGRLGGSVRRHCPPLCIVLAIFVAGCEITPEKKAAAVNDINREFRAEYERILAEKGTRVFKVGRNQAFDAMRVTMLRLGMQIADQDPALGTLNVYGAPDPTAPKPLTPPEWRQAAEADLPRAREIIRRHLGPVIAGFFNFEPEGLAIVMNVTILETRAGSEVSLTMRMRETARPKSDLPRREYPPPTAVRMGLDKIWAEFEEELRTAPRRP